MRRRVKYAYPAPPRQKSLVPRPPAYTVREACEWLGVPENMHRRVGALASEELQKVDLGSGGSPRYARDHLRALIVRMGLIEGDVS